MYSRFVRTTVLASTLIVGLAACETTAGTAIATEGETLPKSKSPGRVAILDNCILNPTAERGNTENIFGATGTAVLTALGDAVIPAVTGFFFDRAIARAEAELKAKSSSTTTKSDGLYDETFYNHDREKDALSRQAACLIFVRPAHKDSKIDTAMRGKVNQAAPNSNWHITMNTAFPGLNLTESTVPEMITEFRLDPVMTYNTTNKKEIEVGYRLRAVSIAYGATGARNTSDENKKDLSFALTLKGLVPKNGTLKEETLYSHSYIFEDLPIGSVILYPEDGEGVPIEIAGQIGPVQSMPAARYKVDKTAFVSTVPLEATIVLTETEQGGDLTRAMIDAIEAKKSEITKPVNDRLKEVVKDVLEEKEDSDG
ncbi:hypothetical protein [Parvularcula marina]|uniref:Lipoprotein n=1 Tax=Parvularcula marina TaxID=2292771 RepID=A0A371REL5_9PROT|nr:hypothetical protein [Parvularcula marina]RFB03870.1 hypothetical protein DX908_00370 [Parvularcula marina]